MLGKSPKVLGENVSQFQRYSSKTTKEGEPPGLINIELNTHVKHDDRSIK